MKDIDADYYGYRDDDDGILVQLEAVEQVRAIQEGLAEWHSLNGKRLKTNDDALSDEENPYEVS